ncbi:MAG: alpha/beta hydrolase [Limosilactobacillus sp.]|nr:alpha/beta hydrolase [Limosilactobacillus sp.]
MKRLVKWLLGIIVVLAIGGWGWLHQATYQPSRPAQQVAAQAKQTRQVTIFPARHSQLTVVLYPGALVKPAAYSIWAQQVAKQGYTVKIVHFPLNLAIFKPQVVQQVVGKHEKYVIGGHSLGGAMAARAVHQHHPRNLKGVFFLASYPDAKGRLDHQRLPVLSIVGSRDGVLKWDRYRQGKHYLPKMTRYVVIKGGNHGNFGSYGHQQGDRTATITNATQQRLIAQELVAWLQQIK